MDPILLAATLVLVLFLIATFTDGKPDDEE
jgi:hypothetical protein